MPTSRGKKDPNEVKRGVGRPRKAPKCPPKPVEGIIAAPKCSRNKLEMYYAFPTAFIRLFNLTKAAAADTVYFQFEPDSLTIYAENHGGGTHLLFEVDVQIATSYYAAEPMLFALQQRQIEQQLLRQLDKDDWEIQFIVRTTDPTTLQIGITESKYASKIVFPILHHMAAEASSLPLFQAITQEREAITNPHLAFTLETHYVKKKIMSNPGSENRVVLAFQNEEDGLVIEIHRPGSHGNSKAILDPSRIALAARDPEDTSRISMYMTSVKPYTTIMGESCRWNLHLTEKAMIHSPSIEGECGIRASIFTEVINDG